MSNTATSFTEMQLITLSLQLVGIKDVANMISM